MTTHTSTNTTRYHIGWDGETNFVRAIHNCSICFEQFSDEVSFKHVESAAIELAVQTVNRKVAKH